MQLRVQPSHEQCNLHPNRTAALPGRPDVLSSPPSTTHLLHPGHGLVTTTGLVLDLTAVTFLAFASEPWEVSHGRDTAQAHRRRRLPLPYPPGRRVRQHRTRPKHVV